MSLSLIYVEKKGHFYLTIKKNCHYIPIISENGKNIQIAFLFVLYHRLLNIECMTNKFKSKCELFERTNTTKFSFDNDQSGVFN